jgi:hypothetical protein
LVAKITASFDLLRKDERLVDTSKEYGLTLRPAHTIADLRTALHEPSVNGALKSYVLLCSPQNGQLDLVLRSSAQEAAETSTYEGKQVQLEDSPINIILSIRKTAEEKKMLAHLIKAIDLWWQRAQEFSATLKKETQKHQGRVCQTKTRSDSCQLADFCHGLLCSTG